MDAEALNLTKRSVVGKRVKQLRRQGVVPVHVYGRGTQPLSLQSEARVLNRVLPRVGTNIPLSLNIEGQSGENICFVREIQRHPVTEHVLHVDFLLVDVSLTMHAEVPVTLVGSSPAVTGHNGTMLQSLLSVSVEALPMNIPATIEVDVSGLVDFEKSIYVRDIKLPANVTMLTDGEDLIARVSAPRLDTDAPTEEGAIVTEFAQDEGHEEETEV
jgi:large subunit ribosomal protein L25